MKNSLRVIIPAAGKGNRLHCSDTPKAMHKIAGKPLLEYVLENTSFIPNNETFIIVGFKKEKIFDYFGTRFNYVEQTEQKGTGHAVSMCTDSFKDFDGDVLVTFGDMPLFRKDILQKICEHHKKTGADCTLLTAFDPEITDWARICRDKNGKFKAIVESADLDSESKDENELFAGVLVFDSKKLFATLPEMSSANNQGEYYLTEIPEIFANKGYKVETLPTDDSNDLRGVNTSEDLVICEKVLRSRLAK